jgi:proteasome lid subunit RPN8/RPN11
MLSAEQAANIERFARSARPLECCGVLLGRDRGAFAVVTDVIRLNNSDTRPGRFTIADREIRRARLLATERQDEVIAIMHSHAWCAPAPSKRDRVAIAISPIPWLIAGFDTNDRLELAAFCGSSGHPLFLLIDGARPPLASAPLDSGSPVAQHPLWRLRGTPVEP